MRKLKDLKSDPKKVAAKVAQQTAIAKLDVNHPDNKKPEVKKPVKTTEVKKPVITERKQYCVIDGTTYQIIKLDHDGELLLRPVKDIEVINVNVGLVTTPQKPVTTPQKPVKPAVKSGIKNTWFCLKYNPNTKKFYITGVGIKDMESKKHDINNKDDALQAIYETFDKTCDSSQTVDVQRITSHLYQIVFKQKA